MNTGKKDGRIYVENEIDGAQNRAVTTTHVMALNSVYEQKPIHV